MCLYLVCTAAALAWLLAGMLQHAKAGGGGGCGAEGPGGEEKAALGMLG